MKTGANKILLTIFVFSLIKCNLYASDPIVASLEVMNSETNFYKNPENILKVRLKLTNTSSKKLAILFKDAMLSNFVCSKVYLKRFIEIKIDHQVGMNRLMLVDSLHKKFLLNWGENLNEFYFDFTEKPIMERMDLTKRVYEDSVLAPWQRLPNHQPYDTDYPILLNPGDSFIKEYNILDLVLYKGRVSIQLKKKSSELKLAYQLLDFSHNGKNRRFAGYELVDFDIISNKVYIKSY